MKKVFTIILAIICYNQIISQSINLNPSVTKQINAEHYGFSYVNFYNTCTDANCVDNVVNLKPRVIRFPSAGDADNYNLNFDTMGYGINFAAIANFLADRYNPMSNPLTTPPFTTYTAPAAFDASVVPVPLKYNASPAVFSSTAAAASYSNELITWYNNYRRQQTQITSSYLTNFKQHIKRIEDSLQPGEKVSVIYVANLFAGTPTTLLKTLKQLTSNSITPVNVVGIEMSNESWGKKNTDIFPDGNAFYNYVMGSLSYTGCINLRGNFIDSIRSHFPNIKIGLPTAPTTYTYYGCSMSSSSSSLFATWNAQLASKINSNITVTVNNTPTIVPTFDAFVIHNYFDDKYWGNTQESTLGSGCNDCLLNAGLPKQYKNYLRACSNPTPGFNHQYSFYPQPEDSILKSSFDCQLNETFKFIDSGFVNNIVNGYRIQLGINNTNQKKIWMTEWNILENNNDDTTYLFHNTFNQAVLTVGWKMAMYSSNWKFPSATDFFQYSTFFNGVSVQQNGGLSKRVGTTTTGDGAVDQPSGNVKRIPYWANMITRHISLDSLKWIEHAATNYSAFPNTRFYSFIDQTNKYVYLYYINANDTDMNLNLDSIKYFNSWVDTNIYTESFSLKNNYSTAGYAQQYDQNKYYRSGSIWNNLINNEPNNTYARANKSGKNQLLKRKSIGFLKLKLNSTVGIKDLVSLNSNIKIFPNPSNGSITVSLINGELNGDIIVNDMLGNTVKSAKINGQYSKLNLDNLANGIYLINVSSKNVSTTYKVILLK